MTTVDNPTRIPMALEPKTHLSHVFTKLDVSNRTELARLAAAHDMRA